VRGGFILLVAIVTSAAVKDCATVVTAETRATATVRVAQPFTAAQTAAPETRATATVRVAQPFRAAQAAAADTRPSFSEWLAAVRAEALTRGIRQEIVDEALSNIDEPMPVILERDRSQAETVFSLETYVQRRLTPRFLKLAREKYAGHRTLLDEVGTGYGVSPRVIAAIWGVESNFGRFSGVRPTISALATLAWDPRRATFFRGELFKALEILNRGDIEFANMKGSWAGAMGQAQFMPSSYLEFAEDYDGDGRRDIWATPADVFASIANYLIGRGWHTGSTWGREVKVNPEAAKRIVNEVGRRNGTCQAIRDMTVALPAKRWNALGVRTLNGKALPTGLPDGSLVAGTKKYYLVFPSYDAILDYNCSHSYAITVGLLSDRIATAPASPAKKSATPSKRAD
jgi:peptidoglycan lytic transglycosylase B